MHQHGIALLPWLHFGLRGRGLVLLVSARSLRWTASMSGGVGSNQGGGGAV